ncbi:MAG: M14 family zinc carboxypeptidase, partial [Solirubrobacteraceae bacterium]
MHRIPRLAVLTAGAVLAFAAPAAAQAPCDPFGATFAGQVPTPKQVLGFDLGKRDVTTAESDRYLKAVDDASSRVITGTLARSVQGRDLRYAIVGQPDRLSAAGLAAVKADTAKLMDPATPAAEAAALAASRPAILWIAGNVHGGEESGTDASLRVLQELADRTDCAAQRIRDEAVVVILPTQNPDGREADSRRNAYGFDMNRDWFARTQPETDGKVEMLRQLPPVLFIDAHEMGNTAGYFFPPNADPIYHELTSQAVGWINGLYGPAMQQVFDVRKIPYFNYATYDLFYMGYGDTVPATGFGAAGMTFEKTNSDPTHKRVSEQYLTQWTSLTQAAANKDAILQGWHDGWVEARRQGVAGELEPNEVVQPGNTIEQPVPDLTVRQYFVRADEPARAREVQSLVRRLQRMDVAVRRLTAPLAVPDLTEYGREPRAATLPAGTYVISMNQRQKHWVQAMLNEDTYVPFPYFYDVTAWSQPLLYDVGGGYSGVAVPMATEAVGPVPDPGVPAPPAGAPSIALYSMSPQFTRGIESSGWLRWLLDRWGLAYEDVSAADIAGGALAGHDVLLVPDGYATRDLSVKGDPYALKDLGPAGQAAIRDWVRGGGRYVGWLDGAVLAAAVGVSSAQLSDAGAAGISSPGALIRAVAAGSSPLLAGAGPSLPTFWDSRYVVQGPAALVPLRYPAATSDDFFVSGYADGAAALGGSAAIVDEPVGSGRTVAFGFEPNFRAFTDGTQTLLRNAILGADPAAPAARIASVRTP